MHPARKVRPLTLLFAACGVALADNVDAVLAAPRSVPLTVAERDGVARFNEPVTSGIPLPKGELNDIDQVRLLRDGREVPAQFRAAGVWRPGGSVRWLLVDFQASLAPEEEQKYVLEYGQGVARTARPSTPVRVEDRDDALAVNTGPAAFRISKRRFSLFEEVRLADGTAVVSDSSAEKPQRGAHVRKLRAMATRPIPSPRNQGNSHLIYASPTDGAAADDYTLRFVTDRRYEVTGAKAGPVGTGEYLQDFAAAHGAIAIPRDAWLPYHLPRQGDVYTFRTIPAGASAASEGVFEAAVLEPGPLRSVIRVKGSLGPASAPALEYTAWYHFHAGSGRVKLEFTLENNHHGGRTPDGNARNAEIGGVNCVFFDEAVLRLPLAVKKHVLARLGGAPDKLELTAALDERVELYQDSSGGDHWDRYRRAECRPRPNSYVSLRGYRMTKGENVFRTGDRALGWMDVSDEALGLTVAIADFWQNYPKALSAGPDGAIEIGLFPGRYAGDFALRSGEHKTHSVLFDFHAAPRGTRHTKALAAAFSTPLRLEAAPAWYARSRALGALHPYDPRQYPAYETRNLSTIGVYPPGEDGPSVPGQIEKYEFHGWMDYGDVPIDFETPSGQWGMKYDMDYHMARQYARTLHPGWWRLFAAAARHTADIDLHHQPHYPGLHFVQGGNWAHSLHDEPGHKNPHRNYNHFTKDLAFAARGTAAFHYLTGNWKCRDACLEVCENALAQYMSPQEKPDPTEHNRMGWRGDACTLNRLLEGWLLSGEEKYLERARWQIATCAYDGRPPKHRPISLWSSVFYMMALSRYVETFPEDEAARGYLLAHLETLRKSIDPEHGIYYTITPQPDGSVQGNGTCSHYNIMAADALAVGYTLTGDRAYLEAARRCFEYGVENACWEGGPATYAQVHSANGAMHGNVFMAVSAAAGSERGERRQASRVPAHTRLR